MPSVSLQQLKEQQEFELVRSWGLHEESKMVVICVPHKMAKRYGFKKQDMFLVIPKEDGILIKKADVKLT